jgi:hypothetical protein
VLVVLKWRWQERPVTLQPSLLAPLGRLRLRFLLLVAMSRVVRSWCLPRVNGRRGASATQMKFTYSTVGLTFTASGASLTNVRYAVITHGASAAVASARKLLCFCQLSATQFTVTSPNTLTVLPAATGVFTLT